ncbi:hypothetical protein Ddc_19655 [Ditylenchus destructor]|nr:hypothetical protein Ddc_19655 [Ditylenchus destructor]
MQSLRRIPAGAQVRVLFPNRSYAASTSNTDALTLRLNAISRLNSGNFLRFDDRNLVRTDFLCFQRRGLQTGVQISGGKKQEPPSSNFLSKLLERRLQSTVQNSEGKKPETSSTNSFLKKLQEETPPAIFLTDLLSFEKFCDKQFKGVDKKMFRESEMKKIKGILRPAYFCLVLLCISIYMLYFACFYEAYSIWSSESNLNSRVEKKYATYLSSESVPFDDCIEKLLKSGKVTQIIHLPHFGKAIAVLSPGAIVDGVTLGEAAALLSPGAIVDVVTAGEEYVVLNLENSPFFVRYLGFVLQVRRMEKQIGIEPSNEVSIKMEGVPELSGISQQLIEGQQLSFRLILLCVILFTLALLAKRKIVKARSMIRGKLTV